MIQSHKRKSLIQSGGVKMKKILSQLNTDKLQMLVNKKLMKQMRHNEELLALERKIECNEKRKVEVVKGHSETRITQLTDAGDKLQDVFYTNHHKWLHKQKEYFYLEERKEFRKASFYRDELVDDFALHSEGDTNTQSFSTSDDQSRNNQPFTYDRLAAVQYAERWWDDHNPHYKNFEVNCTNFVSQCLHAGNASMRGYPNRSSGWWMQQNNWSYSWSVANAMTNFLHHSKTGLRAKKVDRAEQLIPGDLICYDFQGDGRFDHTTFVVAKDEENMPLVNAQTYNSRMRYWAYEDSTAYTPNIQYAFFHIIDDTSSK